MPTATARFYQLLDLPGKDGYLHMVNEAGAPAEIRTAGQREAVDVLRTLLRRVHPTLLPRVS